MVKYIGVLMTKEERPKMIYAVVIFGVKKGKSMKNKRTKEYKEILRSFWAHVIEENEGDIDKIKKCFRGGKNLIEKKGESDD